MVERILFYLLKTIDQTELIKTFEFWADSTVDAEDFIIDKCSNWQIVEKIHVGIEDSLITTILLHYLLMEAISIAKLLSILVTSQERDLIRIFEFEAKEKLHAFDSILISVYIIPHENVWDFRKRATSLEKL